MTDYVGRALHLCIVLLMMGVISVLVLAGLVIIVLRIDGTVLATASSAIGGMVAVPFVHLYHVRKKGKVEP